MKFEEFGLKEPVLSAVKKAGFIEPSPIQEKAIPVVLEGHDLIGCAQTGTGKTAAFVLPILHRLESLESYRTRALVMTPTRELAVQIFENFKKFGRYMKLRACCVYGGAPMGPQRAQLIRGCDILVATPGRLNDFMEQGLIDLKDIEVFVLDEADRMLDMGFIKDVQKVCSKMPKNRQSLLFSATMPKQIKGLAEEILNNPVEVQDKPQSSPADTVQQYLVFVEKGDKKRVLAQLLFGSDVEKSIVFTRTKVGADRLVKRLAEVGIESLAIHGDKTQGQRLNALQRFRTNQVKVLVATDVAARGIDIAGVSHVFNYDLPEEAESYIHRIGRAGRAGKSGVAISLCCEEELGLLAQIEKLIKKPIPEMKTQYSISLQRKSAGLAVKAKSQHSRHRVQRKPVVGSSHAGLKPMRGTQQRHGQQKKSGRSHAQSAKSRKGHRS